MPILSFNHVLWPFLFHFGRNRVECHKKIIQITRQSWSQSIIQITAPSNGCRVRIEVSAASAANTHTHTYTHFDLRKPKAEQKTRPFHPLLKHTSLSRSLSLSPFSFSHLKLSSSSRPISFIHTITSVLVLVASTHRLTHLPPSHQDHHLIFLFFVPPVRYTYNRRQTVNTCALCHLFDSDQSNRHLINLYPVSSSFILILILHFFIIFFFNLLLCTVHLLDITPSFHYLRITFSIIIHSIVIRWIFLSIFSFDVFLIIYRKPFCRIIVHSLSFNLTQTQIRIVLAVIVLDYFRFFIFSISGFNHLSLPARSSSPWHQSQFLVIVVWSTSIHFVLFSFIT